MMVFDRAEVEHHEERDDSAGAPGEVRRADPEAAPDNVGEEVLPEGGRAGEEGASGGGGVAAEAVDRGADPVPEPEEEERVGRKRGVETKGSSRCSSSRRS